MKTKTETKKIYLLIFVLVMMVVGAKAESVPYAYIENDSVLCFTVGDLPNNNSLAWDVSDTGNQQPLWTYLFNEIKIVRFKENFSNARPLSCNGWFYNLQISRIEGIEYLNTSKVTDMSNMFYNCRLNEIDLKGFDTSNVTDMSGMFRYCSALTSIEVYHFNTSKVTTMARMFDACSSLTSLDLRRFDTSNVLDMSYMFYGCKSLTSLDLRSIETPQVTTMTDMFRGCAKLTSLDLRSFNTSKVTDMSGMFGEDWELATIYCNDTWECESSDEMFISCPKLRGAISYDHSKNSAAYANPMTGYFTSKLETYNLSVNGTPVTDVNTWNLACIDGVEGTAYFYDATKTLTLANTTIIPSASNVNAIETNLDSLYIDVHGECVLLSTQGAGIAGSSHIVIKGDGLLIVSGYGAIYWLNQSKSLTIEDGVKVMVQGTNLYAIGPCQSLKVKGSDTYLLMKGAKGSCENVKELTLSDGLAILSPTGAKYDGSTIVDKDGNAIAGDWVTIGYQGVVDSICINNFDWPQDFTAADYEVTTTTPGVKSIAVTYEMFHKELPWHDGYNVCAGSNYGVSFLVELEDGYVFADNVKAYVKRDGTLLKNDFKINVTDQPQKKSFIWATYTVPVPEGGAYLHSAPVVADITAPQAGAKPQWTVSASEQEGQEDGIVYKDINWYKVEADGSMSLVSKGAKFVSRARYCCQLNLFPKEGVQFHQNTKITLNGKQCAPLSEYINQNNVFYNYGDTCIAGYVNSNLAQLYILFYAIGDVNQDGIITMADANAVVNYFLAAEKPSDFNMATADVNGDNIITMADANQIVNMFLAGDVTDKSNGHEYVDLGLSVKWATGNVGAENPEDYGDYFAWGEVQPKSNYSWSTYKWYNGTYSAQSKYNTNDNKKNLEPADDVAVSWGGSWRMPTYKEMEALCDSCYWEWTTDYNETGVAGYIVYKVKSKLDMGKQKTSSSSVTTSASYTLSDNHIFLPAAGKYDGENISQVGSNGNYWSSSLNEDDISQAHNTIFNSKAAVPFYYYRYLGYSVRPVLP